MTTKDVMVKAFEMARADLDNYKRVHIGNEAACVVIFKDGMQVLAVSRRGSPTEFGLPGGKVDNGETLVEGAIREVYEETGIQLCQDELHHLITEDDGHGFIVTTFLYADILTEDAAEQRESDMAVEWVPFQTLIDGPFGEYNQKVLNTLSDWQWGLNL
jgi:8-oxo-dGTP diphosphatase